MRSLRLQQPKTTAASLRQAREGKCLQGAIKALCQLWVMACPAMVGAMVGAGVQGHVNLPWPEPSTIAPAAILRLA